MSTRHALWVTLWSRLTKVQLTNCWKPHLPLIRGMRAQKPIAFHADISWQSSHTLHTATDEAAQYSVGISQPTTKQGKLSSYPGGSRNGGSNDKIALTWAKKARPYLLKINTGDTVYMYPAEMVCVPGRVCHENKSIKYWRRDLSWIEHSYDKHKLTLRLN